MAKKLDCLKVFVGFDPREALAYHVFTQSLIEHSSIPVAIHPLNAKTLRDAYPETDGTNAFTLSRFLVPWMCDFEGWALYVDGDMVLEHDIKPLWDFRHLVYHNIALAVVKHTYQTKHLVKYRDSLMQSTNEHYPRKNWSSLILWNCAHFANRCLEPMFVGLKGGKFLHRFRWLDDNQIASLPVEWNHLVGEITTVKPKLRHFTLGVPALSYYTKVESDAWHASLISMLACAGENPNGIVARSYHHKAESHA